MEPLFNESPLKLMLGNTHSGTLNIKNLNGINSLYQLMRHHQILMDNNQRLNNNNEYNKENINSNINPYNTSNSNILFSIPVKDLVRIPKTNIFNFSRGDRIFNIHYKADYINCLYYISTL